MTTKTFKRRVKSTALPISNYCTQLGTLVDEELGRIDGLIAIQQAPSEAGQLNSARLDVERSLLTLKRIVRSLRSRTMRLAKRLESYAGT